MSREREAGVSEEVEEFAAALADTRYQILLPPMKDAFNKLSASTQDNYRRQAGLLIEMGWKRVKEKK